MLKLIISNGMSASAAECQTQAVLKTLSYTGLEEASGNKMFAGSCAHLCLEQWLLGKSPDDCLDTFKQAYKLHSDTYLPDKGLGSQLKWENLNKILSTYLSLNALNAVDFEVVATEKQLSFELYRDDDVIIEFSDKADGKAKMHADGSFASIEFKTGESIGDDWFDSYTMDGQISGHIAAAQAEDQAVTGVMLVGIQFNKLPEIVYLKSGRAKKCATHHIGMDQCSLDHVKWARRLFIRNADELEQWKHEVISNALDYYKSLVDCKQSLDGIKNVGMRGLLHRSCKRCTFRDYCKSGRSNRNYLQKSPPRDSSVLSSGIYQLPSLSPS